MRRIVSLTALILAAAGPAAAAPEWRQAREIDLLVSSFDIAPSAVRVKAGEPVRLRLVNQSGQTHRVAAPDLFASAKMRARDRKALHGDRIEVRAGETRELVLVPPPGRYRLRSPNVVYRVLGMSAELVAE